MYRKILAMILASIMLGTSVMHVLAEDDQIFEFETEDERVWDNSDPFVYESEMSDDFTVDEWESNNDETESDFEEEIELETDETQEDEASEWEADYEINPIYSDVIGLDDLTEPEPESTDSVLFYADQVDYCTSDEEVISIVREAMVSRTENIVINYRSDIAYARSMVIGWTAGAREHTGKSQEGDYLHLHYGGASWLKSDVTGDDGYHYITIKLTLTYYTDASQELEVTARISEILQSFEFTDITTDIEKFDKIYRWICENVSYDYSTTADDNLKYSTYGALFKHEAVCQGYASLLYRMLLEAGVSNRVITGKSGTTNHAWNIVRIGNVYYNVDVTWDSGRISEKYENLPYTDYFKYMLKSDDTFSNHTRGTDYSNAAFYEVYPMATVDYREQSDNEKHVVSFSDTSDGFQSEIMSIEKYNQIGCMLPDAAGKPYEVTFDSVGGNKIDSIEYERRFLGWNTASDGTGSTYAAYDYLDSDQYTTLYAQWASAELGELPIPERENYIFEGWFTQASGGRQINSGEVITENLTCYAHWRALPTGVVLNKSKVSILREESVDLSANVLPEEAENKKVTWKSSNSAAGIDQNGRVTGIVPGTTIVTVTTQEGGYTAQCIVIVQPKDDIEAFVTRFYNVLLDRQPDPTGLTYWTNLLRSNKRTGESVAHGFVFSNEFSGKKMSDSDFVEYLYKSILGRSSDKKGRIYWCNLLSQKGYTREMVFNGFIDSTEFGSLCEQYGIRRK